MEREEPSVWKSIFQHPEGTLAFAKSLIPSIEAEMTRSGIDQSVLVAFPWQSPVHCTLNNEHLLDLVKHKPDKFFAICSVNPFKPGWQAEVERCKSNGAIGIKINPQWQEGTLSSEAVEALALQCAAKDLLIMTHIDHPYKSSGASPAHFCELLSKCPDTKFIAAHMGGMIGLYTLNQNVKPLLKNVWFDTAVSSTLSMVQHYIDVGLEDKVILGSDFPFNHSHEQKQVVDDLTKLVSDPAIRRKILHANMSALLESLR